MTETKQAHSLANKPEEDMDISFNCYRAVKEAKANARDNIQLLDSVCDRLSILCTNLDRLDAFMETIIFCEKKGKDK